MLPINLVLGLLMIMSEGGCMGVQGCILSVITVAVVASSVFAKPEFKDAANFERLADEFTARRIRELSEFSEVKSVQYSKSVQDPESVGNNPNNLNPYGATSTDHDTVYSECFQRTPNGHRCQEYADPYVPFAHGQDADSSPLERAITQAWLALKRSAQSSRHAIWLVDVKQQGFQPTKSLGGGKVLNRRALKKMDLVAEVKDQSKKIGWDGADALMDKVAKASGQSPNGVRPSLNEMDQRFIAATFTRFMRNRMIQILGELRVDQPGVQFKLGFSPKDCDAYYAFAKSQSPQAQQIERDGAELAMVLKDSSDPLFSRGANSGLDLAYERCKALAQADINMINPKYDSGKKQVVEGNLEDQQIDYSLALANLKAIDSLGAKASDTPLPSYLGMTDEDFKAERYECEPGSFDCKVVSELNDTTREDFNAGLRFAGKKWEEMSQLSPSIPNQREWIDSLQIPKGVSLVEVNGMTGSMKQSMKETQLAQVIDLSNSPKTFEQRPADLTDPKFQASRLVVTKTR